MQELLPSREASRQGALCARYVCCFLLVIYISLFCRAQSAPKVASSDVEAAYLYNFGKFVRFPSVQEQASAPFVICILGEDTFGGGLDPLIAKESIAGRKIVAHRIASPAATRGCQIVFIAQSEE